MNVFVKGVRKLMGWCPNAKKLEAGHQNSSTNFEEYDRSGKEKSRISKVSGQHSRLDVHLLLLPFFFTPIYLNLLFQKGINREAFFLGLSFSLPIYLLGWKKQMHQYDAAKEKPVISPSFRKTLFWIFLVLILGLILPMVFLYDILSYIPSFLNAQSMYSFIAGAWILMGGTYLQLIYWERKNHMKIYIKSEQGFQKMYALEEKAGEL